MSKYIDHISKSMEKKENIRNISIVSHVDHGKTTLSDHLLQSGGLISKTMAGSARALDYLEEEQRRGITIKTANISFIYNYNDTPYLINLVDTPGHVDFSGMVSQALRLVDGTVIVVDAVEQVMAQTESVIRQSMNECLRPILFINKIDRLINELKLPKEEIETRINNIIQMVNELISQYAPERFKKKWKLKFDEGSVIIGAALHGWAISKYSKSIPQFSKIIEFRNALGLVSIILLLWAISGVFGALNRSMNQVWNVQRDRKFLIRKFRDILMALFAGSLLLISIEANSLFPILRSLSIVEASIVLDIAGKLLSMLFVGIAFTLIYKFVPNEKIRWKYIWPGAIFGIVLFDAAKSLFVLYLAHFANYEMIYGSIASVIAFLVWIYYSAIILIMGAELNSEYARMTEK